MKKSFPSNLVLLCLIVIILLNLWSQISLFEEVKLLRAKEDQKFNEMEEKIKNLPSAPQFTIQNTCDTTSINDLDPQKYAEFIRTVGLAIRSYPEGLRGLAMVWAIYAPKPLSQSDLEIIRSFLVNP